MLSTSVIQTFNCTIIRLTSTCFSVIRDNIREHRKMMVNFKPGEHMRKMFIFSQCHLNLVLLACVAWRFWLGAQRRARAEELRGVRERFCGFTAQQCSRQNRHATQLRFVACSRRLGVTSPSACYAGYIGGGKRISQAFRH